MYGTYYNVTVDEGMRICIPERLVTQIEEVSGCAGRAVYVAISHEHEHALYVFANEGDAIRFFSEDREFGRADEVGLQGVSRRIIDKKGRLTLPKSMAKQVSISENTEVCVVGAGSYIEIWNSHVWSKIC